MRRDSTYNQNIKYFVFFLLSIVYLSLSSVYQFFTPLLGFAIYYLLDDFRESENVYPNILVFAYLLLIDVSKGYFFFSSLILFYIIYYFLIEDIEKLFRCRWCIIFGFMAIIYFGYFSLNLFFASLLNQEIPYFSEYLYFYIFIDFILAVLFL